MRGMHSMVAGLDDGDMVWLLSVGKLRTLQPGERLVAISRPLDDLYFIVRGRLTVQTPDDVRVATLDEGEAIGEMSFVARRPPSVSVWAEERSELMMIPRQILLDRFEREPVFAARFYRAIAIMLADRLRETTAAVRAGPEEEAQAHATAQRTGERFRAFVSHLIGRHD